MICHKCNGNIESGEACIPERINGSDHWWYFHPGCYSDHKEEKEKAERRLQNVINMARTVH